MIQMVHSDVLNVLVMIMVLRVMVLELFKVVVQVQKHNFIGRMHICKAISMI
jgi:hypothetical protein